MNLVLGTLAATKPDIVVRIRRGIIQIRIKRTCIRPIVPIASPQLITIQPIPIKEH